MFIHFFTSPLRSQRSWFLLFLVITMLGSLGCNRKKKLAAERARQEALAAEEADQGEREREMDRVRNELGTLIDNPAGSFDDLRDKERELMQIKYQNIDDPEVQALIKQAEYALQEERTKMENLENVESNEGISRTMKEELLDHLQGVSYADSPTLANIRISRALEMFSSDNIPVLIVISEERGRREYDRPTTIKRYLEYLKDQGKSPDYIDRVDLDSNGRIRELELIKK